MKERTVDLVIAALLVAFGLLMRQQLENIPREGVLFPLCVIWLLMGCGALMALRALVSGRGEVSFFGEIPPIRWCLVSGIFLCQVLGALYLSFNLSMGLGMFATLCVLTPNRAGKRRLAGLVGNVAFTVLFLLFFRFFFTDLMHVYFPEPLFG